MRLPRLFNRDPAPAPLATPPPAPPPLPQAEHDELHRAQARVPRKWRAFDQLLEDFASTDVQLRIERKPRRRA